MRHDMSKSAVLAALRLSTLAAWRKASLAVRLFAEMFCAEAPVQGNGHPTDCSLPVYYLKTCVFIAVRLFAEMFCAEAPVQGNGHPTDCSLPVYYLKTCVFIAVRLFAEMFCAEAPVQVNGHPTDCSLPVYYLKTCVFECDAGYKLPDGGFGTVTCSMETGQTEPDWDRTLTTCISKKLNDIHSLLLGLHFYVDS